MIASEQYDCLPVEEVSSMLGEVRVKEYPTFDVQRGIMSKKKVHFHNHDEEEVSISFECDKPQFCSVNEKPIIVNPKSQEFLRLRILVPNNYKEKYLEFVISAKNTETQIICQKNHFKIHLVE